MSTDLWTNRVWQEFHAGNLTRTYRDVLLKLFRYRSTSGHCMPSHATLADRVKCSVRTVQRAMRQAQLAGLVLWTERRIQLGWRWLRTSNSYSFAVPAEPVKPGMRPAFKRPATTGQNGLGDKKFSKKEADHAASLEEMIKDAAGKPNLLERRLAEHQRLRTEVQATRYSSYATP